MSIKKKKHILRSSNDYRWKRIEDLLILKGYILRDDSKDYRVWVDCVGNGRDIRYSITGLLQTPALGLGNPGTRWQAPVFDVMCTHSGSGAQVYQSFSTLRGAIHASRDNPRWHS